MSKLTLSAPPEIIAMAHAQAKREKTSISAIFANFIRARETQKSIEPAPLTMKAVTLGKEAGKKLDNSLSDKELMSDILAEKYGLDK